MSKLSDKEISNLRDAVRGVEELLEDTESMTKGCYTFGHGSYYHSKIVALLEHARKSLPPVTKYVVSYQNVGASEGYKLTYSYDSHVDAMIKVNYLLDNYHQYNNVSVEKITK